MKRISLIKIAATFIIIGGIATLLGFSMNDFSVHGFNQNNWYNMIHLD